MERELWPRLYRLVQSVGATIRQKDVTYQPAVIITVLLWAAIHDRTISWACRGRNWSTTALRPIRLPSPSTMSRRPRSLGVAAVLRGLEGRLRGARAPDLVAVIDGKPLVVVGGSKGPDARCGFGAGKLARGYKLYAIRAGWPVPEAWSVDSLDVDEAREAPGLMARAARGGYLLGDNQYDSSALYDAAAAAGLRPVAAREDPAAGLSRSHYQAADRLRAADEQRPTPAAAAAALRRDFARELSEVRRTIEGRLGDATSFAGGPGPLPAWVRRRHRVTAWVWAKLIINGVRAVKKHRLTA